MEPGTGDEPFVRNARVDRLGREDPYEQSPGDTARSMHSHDVERVVITESELDPHRHHADDATRQPNQNRGHAVDVATGGRDCDESANRARGGTERGGMPGLPALDDEPADDAGTRCE